MSQLKLQKAGDYQVGNSQVIANIIVRNAINHYILATICYHVPQNVFLVHEINMLL